MSDTLYLFIQIMAAFIWGAYMWYRHKNPRDVGAEVRSLNGIAVTVVPGEAGRPRVGLTFSGGSDNDIQTVIGARDARKLAEMIRIAATEGSTLAVARVNYRRQQGPAFAGPGGT